MVITRAKRRELAAGLRVVFAARTEKQTLGLAREDNGRRRAWHTEEEGCMGQCHRYPLKARLRPKVRTARLSTMPRFTASATFLGRSSGYEFMRQA